MAWWMVALAGSSFASTPDVFEAWLGGPGPVARGFAEPAGWASCGPGCWSADAPREVGALAAGRVDAIGADWVIVRHVVYVDEVRRDVRSVYGGLTPTVAPGDVVAQGGALGISARVAWSIDGEDGPRFVAEHAELFDPRSEPLLVLVSHDELTLALVEHGVIVARYPIAVGQAEGDKQRRGDNKTPRGMYFVVARSTGPFTGPTGPWFGGYWIKLNYPNAYDAERGRALGWVTDEQAATIRADWAARRLTDQSTRLGSGIGLHGWVQPWDLDGPRGLSWGCVVLQPSDVGAAYDAIPMGAMVVLL